MRRILFLGAAAMLLAAPLVKADIGPRPGPRPVLPAMQAPKFKLSIEVDEKATEPRLLVPMQAMMGGFNFGGGFGGGVGAAGFGGGVGAIGVPPGAAGAAGMGGAFGVGGVPPGAAFGVGGGAGGVPPAGQKGNPPPGVFGQLGGNPPLPPGGNDEESTGEQSQENRRQSSLPISTIIIGLALTLSFSTGGLWLARKKSGTLGGATPLGVLVAVLSIGLLSGAAVWANRAPPVRPPVKPVQPQIPGPLPALMKMEGVKIEMLPQGDTIRLILTKKHKEQLKGKDAPAPTAKPEEK